MKSITCTECDKEIIHRSDLRVAGKLLQPYHASCLANPKSILGKIHKFIGCFPMGAKFWFLLLLGNLMLGFLIRDNIGSTAILASFRLIFNAVFIFARLGIYYNYERYLE